MTMYAWRNSRATKLTSAFIGGDTDAELKQQVQRFRNRFHPARRRSSV